MKILVTFPDSTTGLIEREDLISLVDAIEKFLIEDTSYYPLDDVWDAYFYYVSLLRTCQ